MQIKKAVFPAAGFGTRFLPATKAQPKEMLTIVDKPVIQYLVEEAVASGIEDIIMITGRGKRAIEDHFDHSFELEHTLVEKGKRSLLKEVRAIEELARFTYIRQPRPLGDGHAILCAKGSLDGEPFAVLFGDDLVDSDVPALKQLMEVFKIKKAPVIGLQKIPKKDSRKYGIVSSKLLSGGIHEIKGLVEKPEPADAPSDLAIIGKYILTPDIFPALEKAAPAKDGEIRLIDGLKRLLRERPIYGCEIKGKRYDTGDKFGFLKATLDFALKRPDLRKPLLKYIKSLDL